MSISKMKILLFTDTFCDINGVSRFIQDIAHISQERKLTFHVVTSSVKTCPTMENLTLLKPKMRMKIPFYPQLDLVYPSYSALEEITKKINPDIIHISTPGLVGWMGRNIAKKHKIPILGTYHTDFSQFAYKNIPLKIVKTLTDRLMASFYKDFKALFVRSEAYRQIVKEDVKFDEAHIYRLISGTNREKFNTKYKDMQIWETYGIPQNATKALYVGRLTKEKNFPLLLDLWKRYYTKSSTKNIYLIVAGGELKDTTLFETYHIKSVGVQQGEALSKLYASSDLFLFPSTTDTLGQVVMEAIASGLPVIVSNEGGPKSLIDSKNPAGYAIDVKDEQRWLDTMGRVIEDQALRQELSQNGYQTMNAMGIEKSFDYFWKIHEQYLPAKDS